MIKIGARVRFAPNPRFPLKLVEAEVIFRRMDPRTITSRSNIASPNGGWLDTRDEAGVERSVRPSRCEVIA